MPVLPRKRCSMGAHCTVHRATPRRAPAIGETPSVQPPVDEPRPLSVMTWCRWMWALVIPACSFDTTGAATLGEASTGGTAGDATGGDGVATSATDGGEDSTTAKGSGSGSDGPTRGSGESGAPADWWNRDWTYRRRISIVGANTKTSLSDVPVLLVVSGSSFDLQQFAAGGNDLRFVSSDGITVFALEVERWDAAGTSHVWFRMDEIDPEDTDAWLWMYWGNPEADVLDDSSDVWSNGYRGVWHFEAPLDGDPGSYTDSVEGHEAAPSLGVTESTVGPGWVGRGLELDGVDDHFSVDDLTMDDWSAFVVEAWIRPTDTSGRIACKTPNLIDTAHVWCLGLAEGDLDVWLSTDGTDGESERHQDLATPTPEEWTWVAAAWDASDSTLVLYVNGVPLTELEQPGGTLLDSSQPVVFGNANLLDPVRYRGGIDELRFASVSRSPGWFAVQAQSMNDELFEFGPVEMR